MLVPVDMMIGLVELEEIEPIEIFIAGISKVCTRVFMARGSLSSSDSEKVPDLLERYSLGDWGDLTDEYDIWSNKESLKRREGCIFARYGSIAVITSFKDPRNPMTFVFLFIQVSNFEELINS